MAIYTIGHSSLDSDRFIEYCRKGNVQTVMDIRSHPTSTWPQWHKPEIEKWLPAAGIGYEWEPHLGGWTEEHAADDKLRLAMAEQGVDLDAYARGYFPKNRIGGSRGGSDEPSWTSQGLWDYQWYMTTPEFMEAAQRLSLRQGDHVAVMCAEFLWWKCHRSMVADYLSGVLDVPVFHLMPKWARHDPAPRLERYEQGVHEAWAGV